MSTATIFYKGARPLKRGEQSLSSHCWDHRTSTGKRVKLDPYLTPYVKLNSKSNT